MKVQLDYMWKELQSSEKSALKALESTHSPGQAAAAFCKHFERPGIPRLENRERFASQAYSNFAGSYSLARGSNHDSLQEGSHHPHNYYMLKDKSADDSKGGDHERVGSVNSRVHAAESLEGKELWHGYQGQTENGRLGCAVSVSKALQASGIKIPDILNVGGVRNFLVNHLHWTIHPGSQRQSGDVFYGSGGRHGHIGVVGADGNHIWNNSSPHGRRWSLTSEEMGLGRFHGKVFAIRPQHGD